MFETVLVLIILAAPFALGFFFPVVTFFISVFIWLGLGVLSCIGGLPIFSALLVGVSVFALCAHFSLWNPIYAGLSSAAITFLISWLIKLSQRKNSTNKGVNDMAETKPLIFTMLGPSGSGKTSMLACMNRELESMIPGTFYPDRRTFGILEDAYQRLKESANPSTLNISAVKNTEDMTSFDFKIKGNKNIMPVRFFDFPGKWIDRKASDQDYNQVIRLMKQSLVFIVAVDTPYLMEQGGKYAEQAAIRDVELMIKEVIGESDKQERLILLVPIKCEKYMESWSSQQALKQAVKNAFHDTIKMGQETYKGKLAIAIVPINTMGNVKFSYLKTAGGRAVEQVFMKVNGKSFSPEYTDQPLRFAMSFLFEQFKKEQKRSKSILRKMLHWVCVWDWEFFSPDNMPDIAKYVRSGISSGSSRNEIICGKELMGV